MDRRWMQLRIGQGSSSRSGTLSTTATGVAALAVTALIAGCGPSQEAGFEQAPRNDEAAEGEHIAPESQRACDVVDDALDANELSSLTLEEALEQVPQLSAAARIVTREPVREELARFDQVTFFAPLDGAIPEDPRAADPDEVLEEGETPLEDDAPPPETPARAYFHPDAALTVASLAQVQSIDVADGGSLAIQVVDDRATIERDGATAEIICSDIQLAGAVLHIVDADPYVPVDGEREPDADIEQEETPPEVPQQLDEEQE